MQVVPYMVSTGNWDIMPSGNCMSIPVVGSVLLSVLTYGNFGEGRQHFRQGYVPTPTSQATTLALPGNESEDSCGTSDDEE